MPHGGPCARLTAERCPRRAFLRKADCQALPPQGAAQQDADQRGRRKPPQNWLERGAVLQAIAVVIAACALARLVLACYADDGFVQLLSARCVFPASPW